MPWEALSYIFYLSCDLLNFDPSSEYVVSNVLMKNKYLVFVCKKSPETSFMHNSGVLLEGLSIINKIFY
jgi:hypothetical protein